MIFVLRQIQEKCREQNMGLSAVFTDLTKAFDNNNNCKQERVRRQLPSMSMNPKMSVTLYRPL